MMDKISNQTVRQSTKEAQATPSKKSKAPGEKGFADELSLAGLAQMAQAPAQQNATQVQLSPDAKDGKGEQQDEKSGMEAVKLVKAGQELKAGQQNEAAINALAQKMGQEGPLQAQALQATQALRERGNALMSAAERAPLSMKSAASTNTANAIAGLKPWSKDWVFEGHEDQVDLKSLLEAAQKSKMAQMGQAQGTQNLRTGGEAKGPETMSAAEGGKLVGNGAAADQLEASQLASQHHAMLQSGLEAQLQALGGGEMKLTDAVGAKAGETGKKTVANLSGGDYLTTLASIRSAQQEAARGGMQGQEQDGGSQQDRKSGPGTEGPQLRVIEGGSKAKKSGFEQDLLSARMPSEAMHPGVSHAASSQFAPGQTAPAEMTGHVTKGAMSQDRLSSESLAGLSAGIRNLSPQGGGEIRVRLNPENLGELHIRVMTQGNQVGLQIQASDDKAKKILSESISHLKESLAASHLTLGQVDLTVSSSHQSAMSGDARQDQGNNPQQSFFSDLNQQGRGQNGFGSGGNSSDRWSGNEAGTRTQPQASVRSSSFLTGGAAARSVSSDGRIDVRA